MHCPENITGDEYVELVAAASLLLSRNLSARQTFILADFLQSVSTQLYTLAAFKEAERIRADKQRAERERTEKKARGDGAERNRPEPPPLSGPPPRV